MMNVIQVATIDHFGIHHHELKLRSINPATVMHQRVSGAESMQKVACDCEP